MGLQHDVWRVDSGSRSNHEASVWPGIKFFRSERPSIYDATEVVPLARNAHRLLQAVPHDVLLPVTRYDGPWIPRLGLLLARVDYHVVNELHICSWGERLDGLGLSLKRHRCAKVLVLHSSNGCGNHHSLRPPALLLRGGLVRTPRAILGHARLAAGAGFSWPPLVVQARIRRSAIPVRNDGDDLGFVRVRSLQRASSRLEDVHVVAGIQILVACAHVEDGLVPRVVPNDRRVLSRALLHAVALFHRIPPRLIQVEARGRLGKAWTKQKGYDPRKTHNTGQDGKPLDVIPVRSPPPEAARHSHPVERLHLSPYEPKPKQNTQKRGRGRERGRRQ
mmetsp:Transcript_13899/g.39218  ORF Transcript_13899/g.39218 Transcript_13899/m.39218 type:complete len:334 (+) Transcript_13899:3705-4706(+)